jgi:uncharacterized UPF0160 family protein
MSGKKEKKMKLGTHNGNFHADEVFATAFLLKLYPQAQIVRSREADVLVACDIVYDVGHGIYDHHARDKEYRDNGIPFAASGLIWRDFGKKILQKEGLDEPKLVDSLVAEIDEKFVQPIDAQDNGVNIDKSMPILDIAGVVRLLNPAWDREASDDELFEKAVAFASLVFNAYLDKMLAGSRAVPLVQQAFDTRQIPQLVILEQGCPWEKTLLQLDHQEEVLYVIRPGKNGQYTIQGVPQKIGAFAVRKQFPQDWGGLEGEELVHATHVEGAIFCHSGLWLAVAQTLDGAIQMGKLAIQA